LKNLPRHPAAAIVVSLVLAVAAVRLAAQAIYDPAYAFTTFAGTPSRGATDGPSDAARFSNPSGVAVDRTGNVFVADQDNHTVRKITPDGIVTTFAGAAGETGSTDGIGSAARFFRPAGLAFDASGTLFVADTGNHTIRKITPAGAVTTFAGSAGQLGSADGFGDIARFNAPGGVAVGNGGNVYIADTNNHTVRQISPSGLVTTFAGSPTSSGTQDGTGNNAGFGFTVGVAVDANGDVFVAEPSRIRKITPSRVVTTLAGSSFFGYADGAGTAAQFNGASGIAIDPSGNLLVTEIINNTIRKVTQEGVVTTVAGIRSSQGGAVDGPANAARFNRPRAIVAESDGNLLVADSNNQSIRRISTTGVVTTVAGLANNVGSIDGAGSTARFNTPGGMAVDRDGNIYIAEYYGTIRKITPAGIVTILAGAAGLPGFTDGVGGAARFSTPSALAVDGSGNVYVADTYGHTIRKITPAAVVTTLAGSAGRSGYVDGTGAAARFRYPMGIAADAAGNVFVSDTDNFVIRKITPDGVVSTLAGMADETGSTDGVGSSARFVGPGGLDVDASGNLFVADFRNHTIRRITPNGAVTTYAGSAGNSGYVDGNVAVARLNVPSDVALDATGNVFITDNRNQCVRRISPAGLVTTIAGLAGMTGSADGTGRAARFGTPDDSGNPRGPVGLAVDRQGAIFVADTFNHTIRRGVVSLTSSATARLINLSVRKVIGPDTLTVGFVLRGAASKPMLVRAVGPGLAAFGATNALTTPMLTLNRSGTGSGMVVTNSGWGGSVTLADAFTRVGAFPLAPNSADAAALPTLQGADYTVQVASSNGARGDALVEVYDMEWINSATRLANVSAQATTGSADNVLSAGFVIGGGNMQVLIRGVGPGLGQFGVPGVLAAPRLTVFSDDTPIATNTRWGGSSDLTAAFRRVGAFPLPTDSVDAALLLTLAPGNYTAQLTSTDSATGAAIIEVYEVPSP
jgi:sugar lactone lactonase YvrE